MDFGDALSKLKEGKFISRSGWNGKNMFLFIVDVGRIEHPLNSPLHEKSYAAARHVVHQSYIAMFTAQLTVVPWVASQSDILASDWYVFDQ